MWESCCLKCIFRRSLKKKACMLIITMIRKIQKPITIVQRTVFYRLCGCASGVLIAVIWNCAMLIRHLLLHYVAYGIPSSPSPSMQRLSCEIVRSGSCSNKRVGKFFNRQYLLGFCHVFYFRRQGNAPTRHLLLFAPLLLFFP